jgi:hypothetical protein
MLEVLSRGEIEDGHGANFLLGEVGQLTEESVAVYESTSH